MEDQVPTCVGFYPHTGGRVGQGTVVRTGESRVGPGVRQTRVRLGRDFRCLPCLFEVLIHAFVPLTRDPEDKRTLDRATRRSVTVRTMSLWKTLGETTVISRFWRLPVPTGDLNLPGRGCDQRGFGVDTQCSRKTITLVSTKLRNPETFLAR